MFRTVCTVAAVFASVPAVAQTESFTIGDTVISFPVPADYCRPSGDAATAYDRTMKLDTLNITHLILVPCAKRATELIDHIMVQSPRVATDRKVARSDLLVMMKPVGDQPGFSAAVDKHLDAIKDKFDDTFGQKIDIADDIRGRGQDDVCDYNAGVLRVAGEKTGPVPPIGAASCLSSVGEKVLTVNVYSPDASALSIRKLMARARAAVLTMSGRNAD